MLKVIEIALAEDGYLEKKSNASLDSKTANAGSNNYTKFAQYLDSINYFNGRKNGHAWCAVFVCWCMVQAYGVDKAKKMMFQPQSGNYAAGCTEAAAYYKSANAFYKTPEVGDQIFFTNDGGKTSSHTGIVIDVSQDKVFTIEGNTSSAAGVIANGGSVARKSYALNYNKILGYGRPNYTLISNISGAKTAEKEQKSAMVEYEKWKGGTIAKIPLNMIDRISHEPMNGAGGEYSSYAAKRIKWNNRYPEILSNAELFNMTTYAPASGVKEDGKILLKGWQSGLGFRDCKTIVWEGYGNPASIDWVGGYPALIQNGQKLNYQIPAGLGGKSLRTAVGINNTTLFFIWTKQGATLDEITDKMLSLGAKYAINLDGGGSTSFVTPDEQFGQDRKLRGFICVWLKGGNGNKMARNGSATVTTQQATTTAPSQSGSTMQQDMNAKNGVALTVTASTLNLRDGKGDVIATMPRGAKVQWYGFFTNKWVRSGTWYYVKYGDKSGYASVSYLKK